MDINDFGKKQKNKFLNCKKCACLFETATNIVTKQQNAE